MGEILIQFFLPEFFPECARVPDVFSLIGEVSPKGISDERAPRLHT